MKCCAIVLALSAVYVYGAPTGSLSGSLSVAPGAATGSASSSIGGASGTLTSNVGNPGGTLTSSVKAGPVDPVSGFKGFLLLFAPNNWIDLYNAIPLEGQQCFIKAVGNPDNQKVFSGDDFENMKTTLQNLCQTYSSQLGAFFDAMSASYKSLPQSFGDLSKTFGDSMVTLGEQLNQTALANPGVQGKQALNLYKPYLQQFSTALGIYLQKISELSDADRQQITTAFPKLQAFFSGDQAVNFFKQAGAIYTTLGSANIDTNALQTQGEQFQQTFKTVYQQYATQNADALKQAGPLLHIDFDNLNTQIQADTSTGGINGFTNAHPTLARLMKQAHDENTREQFGKFSNSVKENTDALKNKFNGAPDSASFQASVQ